MKFALRPAAYRHAARTAATAGLLLAVSGCGAADLLTHQESRTFDHRSDAADTQLAFRLPDLVPADATDITVKVRTEDPNSKVFSWSSATDGLPSDCSPGDVPAGAPAVAAFGGWPSKVGRTAGQRCGPLYVTHVDDRSYAWLVPAEPGDAATATARPSTLTTPTSPPSPTSNSTSTSTSTSTSRP